VQDVTRTGVETSYSAASAGGDLFTAGRSTFFVVKNGSGGPVTINLGTPGDVRGLAISNVVKSVSAGGQRVFGPFPPDLFANAAGMVQVIYGSTSSVTVAALKFA